MQAARLLDPEEGLPPKEEDMLKSRAVVLGCDYSMVITIIIQ